MNLYELGEEAQMGNDAIMKWAEEHNGDISECPMVEIMEKIEGDITKKLLGWGVWFKNIESDSNELSNEIAKLAYRKKVLDNQADRIKATISHFLNEQKLVNSKVVINRTKSKQVVVSDKESLDKKYLRVIPEKSEPDKNAIKAAVKAGEKITGAAVVNKENVSIK